MTSRTQLTLFVPPLAAGPIESLRAEFDPVQHALIRAHVTLCREDEIGAGEVCIATLASRHLPAVTLTFGAAVAFGGHGIMLPCVGGETGFQLLRAGVFSPAAARAADAHITLAHPRNRCAPRNSIVTARRLQVPLDVTFTTLALIEQREGAPWDMIWTRDLDAEPLVRPARCSSHSTVNS